ncbi:hypothetical protein FALBO_16252 [Fusarium albosuccineum]|uniref:Uncharacterized protein n=1 Tax=Fusarium albosuccineum TaxID=1237068 RepID=A0A8H4KLN0_9HYPO|nr:hypothetical protein FALBO_16252 [Fusarium albosuccineum]
MVSADARLVVFYELNIARVGVCRRTQDPTFGSEEKLSKPQAEHGGITVFMKPFVLPTRVSRGRVISVSRVIRHREYLIHTNEGPEEQDDVGKVGSVEFAHSFGGGAGKRAVDSSYIELYEDCTILQMPS